MDSRFAVATHVLGLLAWQGARGGGPLTSDELARSVNTHPVVIRRVLGALRAAGLVSTRRGAGGGAALALPAEQISLRAVYEAVAEDATLLHCAPGTASTRCDRGQQVRRWLDATFAEAEEALKQRLEARTIAELRDAVGSGAG